MTRPYGAGVFGFLSGGWMVAEHRIGDLARSVVVLAANRFPDEIAFDAAALSRFGREGNAFETVAALAAIAVRRSDLEWAAREIGVEPFRTATSPEYGTALALVQAAEPGARRLWRERTSIPIPRFQA